MFGRLLSSWRKKDLLSQAFDEFHQMLADTEWMFDMVTDVLLCKRPAADVKDQLEKKDEIVNNRERLVRRKIIEYLTLNPEGDVPAALVLFTVVKDAERLGDYCKNILEIAQFLPGCLEHGVYETPLTEMESEIELMFARTKKAFINSDEQVAREAVEIKRRISVKADMLLKQLLEDKNIPVRQAVIYTLLERYFKRVASHLDNIASAVLNPVSDIDMDAK